MVSMVFAASSSMGQQVPDVAVRDSAATGLDAWRTVEERMESESLAGERVFTVHLPRAYATYDSHRFPVLYLLDGETNLAHAGPVVDFLAENGRIPEMIIVAIHAGATRSQDFMPPVEGQDDAHDRGEAFLAFLESELIPYVDAEYRTAPLRLVSGHSLGGLFVTWAMASGSELANAWLAQSPYLVGNVGGKVLEEVGSATLAAASTAGPAHAASYYYANLGAEPDLSANFDMLEEELTGLDSEELVWKLERLSEESHMSTRLLGLYAGLSGYFEGVWSIGSAELMESGTEGLAEHVAALSDRYGYPVLLNEQPFQELTQGFLRQRDMASAVKAAALYVANHEPSVVAHFMHGVALASSGQRAEGLSEIERAMTLFESRPDPALASVYAQLKQLQQQLKK